MKTKSSPKIRAAARPARLTSVLPPAVGDGHTRTAPATVAARLPRAPTHAATQGNHALHHAPRNAQS